MEMGLIKEVAILLSGAFLTVQLYFNLRHRRNVARLFVGLQVEKSTLAAIEDALRIINTESYQLVFSMRQVANISFRGKSIFLVKGLVGQASALGMFGMSWRALPGVYAVGDFGQSEWMRLNRDVFKPAFTGSSFSVFWVRTSRIKQRDLL